MSKKEMTLTPAWEVRTTLPTEAAAIEMATTLVESRLAACVQITGPIRSIYRWKNEVQNELEWSLSIKTVETALPRIMERIRSIHPYDVPEILANPIQYISDSYHQWLVDELNSIAERSSTVPTQRESWHLQIQTIGNDAVRVGLLEVDASSDGTSGFRNCEQWSLPSGPSPLAVTFESVAETLSPWPGMHFEMDGSFVWVSPERDQSGKPIWQLDGMIYDRNDLVQYIELKGSCDHAAWIKLVSVLYEKATDGDQARIAIHLIKQSAWILESDFRKAIA